MGGDGPLAGFRIVSLALNLPGPAALMRCRAMGADCVKVEPPAGDPMRHYSETAHAAMGEGIPVLTLDLKSGAGRQALGAELARADALLTAFRPAALERLGLSWPSLQRRFPSLCQVAIVGGAGALADEAGHDLTYAAAQGLVPGLELPPTLFADMGGALLASEAVLGALLRRQRQGGRGVFAEVALQEAAGWLALPRRWGAMRPDGPLAGGFAGYGVYACLDGRVALAALEPHFLQALCEATGIDAGLFADAQRLGEAKAALSGFFANRSRADLEALAKARDIPMVTMAE